MPELDYALLCDYVRTEQAGVAHVIAAGIDTVSLPQVPGAANLGLLVRLTFTRGECDKPHRLEAILADTDGEPIARINGVITPAWKAGLPPGWKTGAQLALNFGLMLPKYGEYSMDILVNDSSVKDINLYVTLMDGGMVAKSIRIDTGTLVDVDRHGRPMGIEIIRPARPWPLQDILERFHVRTEDRRLLEELQGTQAGPVRRPFVEPVQLASA